MEKKAKNAKGHSSYGGKNEKWNNFQNTKKHEFPFVATFFSKDHYSAVNFFVPVSNRLIFKKFSKVGPLNSKDVESMFIPS